jgi:hypothetical protein
MRRIWGASQRTYGRELLVEDEPQRQQGDVEQQSLQLPIEH